MRTAAKNLVTTARTINLPEQKETIHMISMLRKEACSGNIHDLPHSPTLKMFGRLFDEGISEDRQPDHSSENSEISRC